jgi:hypothetical protein
MSNRIASLNTTSVILPRAGTLRAHAPCMVRASQVNRGTAPVRIGRSVNQIHARALVVVGTARRCRAMRVAIWLLVLLVSSLWQGEASADDAPPWTPRRTVVLRPPPEPDDNWVETDQPAQETAPLPQRAEQPPQEIAEPSQEAEPPPRGTPPELVEIDGSPPGYHVERKPNYTLLVGGVLVATAGLALFVAGIATNILEDENTDDGGLRTSPKDVDGDRLSALGLGVGGVGTILIVLGATSGDPVYVPSRVASVAIVPVVGRDRAGGALTLTF